MKLPKYVTVETARGKTYVYFRRDKNSPRFRLPSDIDSSEFHDAYRQAVSHARVRDVRDMKPTPKQDRERRSILSLKSGFRAARTRARAKGLPFDLTLEFILDQAAAQDFRCKLTGIEFFAKKTAKGRVNPYTPSLDRIEPSKGYVRDNVRVVIYAVNAMILDWGEDLFMEIANSHRYWRRTERLRSISKHSRFGP